MLRKGKTSVVVVAFYSKQFPAISKNFDGSCMINTLYQLMLQSWYQKIALLSVGVKLP